MDNHPPESPLHRSHNDPPKLSVPRVYDSRHDLRARARKSAVLDALAQLEADDSRTFANRALRLVELDRINHALPKDTHAREFTALDIATSCDIAQSTASTRLHRAQHLVNDLPATVRCLHEGWLRVHQALALMQETEGLLRPVCHEVERRALDAIAGLTAGDSRRVIKRLVGRSTPTPLRARRQEQAPATPRLEQRPPRRPRPHRRQSSAPKTPAPSSAP